MTTITELIDGVQAINRSITGIRYAPTYTNYPNTLTSERLPTAVTWHAGEDWHKGGMLNLQIEVYVAAIDPNVGTQAMKDGLNLLERFKETWQTQGNVNAIAIMTGNHTTKAGFGTEGMHKTLGYGGNEYFGFIVHIPLFYVI